MGLLEQLSRKSGVIVGDDVLRLFQYAQEKNFAVPAIVSPPPSFLLPKGEGKDERTLSNGNRT